MFDERASLAAGTAFGAAISTCAHPSRFNAREVAPVQRDVRRVSLNHPATEPTDLQLAARGDAAAVRRVVERTGPWVHSLVRARAGADHDVVVAIYERLWRECAEFDPRVESELLFVARLARRELRQRGWRAASASRSETGGRQAARAAEGDRFQPDAAAGMPCQESERLAPFLARLDSEQMKLLREALHEGRNPRTDGPADTEQRDQLRSLLMDARRSLRTAGSGGKGLR